MTAPYTPNPMDDARATSEARDGRFDGLVAEASAAVGYSANTLRGVRERYREAYAEAIHRWQALREELSAADRAPLRNGPRDDADGDPEQAAAVAAEAGAGDARLRALRNEVEMLGGEVGRYQSTLAKLDVAERNLSRTWLFLERGDASLVASADDPPADEADISMRIIEAQEGERARLAQEIHDGPAQALTNAIFQTDFIERILTEDPDATDEQVRILRDLLRRELGNVRDFLNQLRPATLDQLGLSGAIEDAVEHLRSTSDLRLDTSLAGTDRDLDDRQRTVALRVTQEALQNVRKHAGARTVAVTTLNDDDGWVLEIRDDGRGFDTGAVAAWGRRNFGLQFMQERAGLIGGRFDVRSRPDGGTVVRLAIPTKAPTGAKENG